MRGIIGLLLLLLLFTACSKEELIVAVGTEELENTDFFDCHNGDAWPESQVLETLSGDWDWRASFNPWTGLYNDQVELGTTLRFMNDSSVQVWVSGALETTLSLILTENAPNYFSISTEPFDHRVAGNILFCEDLVVFMNSFVDGEDIFYQKVDD